MAIGFCETLHHCHAATFGVMIVRQAGGWLHVVTHFTVGIVLIDHGGIEMKS